MGRKEAITQNKNFLPFAKQKKREKRRENKILSRCIIKFPQIRRIPSQLIVMAKRKPSSVSRRHWCCCGRCHRRSYYCYGMGTLFHGIQCCLITVCVDGFGTHRKGTHHVWRVYWTAFCECVFVCVNTFINPNLIEIQFTVQNELPYPID